MLSDRVDQIAWNEFALADWELFSQMADREGIAPLMYWKLKDSPVEIPPSTFNFLRSTYYQTLAQNTLMYQELERILKALDAAGIPVIVLKGAALAATVYEDIGLRPMGDLDLLVKEQHLQKALDLICSLGYVQEPMPHEKFNQQIGYDVHLWNGLNDKMKVELHWQLVVGGDDWPSANMGWFWEERVSPTLDKDAQNDLLYNLTKLSPEASLLYSVGHLLLQHGVKQARLLWFFDIQILLSKHMQTLNWQSLLKEANELHWTAALLTALALVEQLFSTSLRDTPAYDLLRQVRRSPDNDSLFPGRMLRTRTKATDVWSSLQMLDHGKRVRYALGMVFPNPDFMRWRYRPRPAWLWPLCYPYRFFMMIKAAIVTYSILVLPRRER